MTTGLDLENGADMNLVPKWLETELSWCRHSSGAELTLICLN